jgi:hypothetical protein
VLFKRNSGKQAVRKHNNSDKILAFSTAHSSVVKDYSVYVAFTSIEAHPVAQCFMK